jgi:hypothetical protein
VQGKRCFVDKYQIYQKEINLICRDNFRMEKCFYSSEIQLVSDRNTAQNKITTSWGRAVPSSG